MAFVDVAATSAPVDPGKKILLGGSPSNQKSRRQKRSSETPANIEGMAASGITNPSTWPEPFQPVPTRGASVEREMIQARQPWIRRHRLRPVTLRAEEPTRHDVGLCHASQRHSPLPAREDERAPPPTLTRLHQATPSGNKREEERGEGTGGGWSWARCGWWSRTGAIPFYRIGSWTSACCLFFLKLKLTAVAFFFFE